MDRTAAGPGEPGGALLARIVRYDMATRAEPGDRRPYVVGITGGVAVGKSVLARSVATELAGGPGQPGVEVVSTDGFLLPGAEMAARGLLHRKGFPESYDQDRLRRFLEQLAAGEPEVSAPVYSHESYDVLPGTFQVLRRPAVVVLEGLHLLLPGFTAGCEEGDGGQGELAGQGDPGGGVGVERFLDLSVYLDAPEDLVVEWYLRRVEEIWREAVAGGPSSRFAGLDEEVVRQGALRVWREVNQVNYRRHIAPTRERADVVVRKGTAHRIASVWLHVADQPPAPAT